MADLQELDKTFSIHEQVRAERWKETIIRIKRLESVLIASAGAIILLLIGIAFRVH